MMLRELEAFEACWLDLKDVYPTNRQDNMMLAHAMGQLVDLLAKPTQVEQDLPDHLKALFRRLALAYFQGYSREEGQVAAPIAPRLPIPSTYPHCALLRHHEISAAVSQVKALAQKKQARQGRQPGQIAPCPMSEMETLVIEFPEHWPEQWPEHWNDPVPQEA